MNTVNEKAALEAKIAFLKSKQNSDLVILKNQYRDTIDSFKPINLIKNSIEDAITSPNLKANLITGTVGFGINYLAKNFLNKHSGTNKKSILGNVLKFVVKNFIGRKS